MPSAILQLTRFRSPLRAAFSSLSPLRSDSVKKMLSEMKNLLFLKGDPLLSDLLKNLLPSTRSSLNINN